MIGIYKITNKLNNKCYIGKAQNIELRWEQHKKALLNSQQSWYPIAREESDSLQDFDFEILQECDINELNELEEYWTLFYNSHLTGYNKKIADGSILLKSDDETIKFNQLQLFQKINEKIQGKSGAVRTLMYYFIILYSLNTKILPSEQTILRMCNISHSRYVEARKTLNENEFITYIQNQSITINFKKIIK